MQANFNKNSLERLIQEHAIYKKFFMDIVNRPNNPADFNNYWKAKAFDAEELLNNLNNNIPYYDPAWKDANAVLFQIIVETDLKFDGPGI